MVISMINYMNNHDIVVIDSALEGAKCQEITMKEYIGK